MIKVLLVSSLTVNDIEFCKQFHTHTVGKLKWLQNESKPEFVIFGVMTNNFFDP